MRKEQVMGIRVDDYIEDRVIESKSRTTSADSGIIDLPMERYDELRIQLDVTAASGTTPTLDVVVEDTLDGVNFNTIATFTQATGVTREVKNVTTPFGRRLRVKWTLGGTSPNFTFSTDIVGKGR